MLEFSASAETTGKVAYKGYVAQKVNSFNDIADLAVEHSLSSMFYGDGETEGGEKCSGHRAGRSVIGAGNIMFFDFDNKGMTLEQLEAGFAKAGTGGWIGPSKSCDIEAGVLKFHVAVAFDRELPVDKDAYEQLYLATIQYMGFTGFDDPCMKGMTQQIAPHWKKDGFRVIIDGAPLDMVDVMAAYVPDETVVERKTESFAGEISGDTVFTLSSDGRQVTVKEILDMVADGSKVRVHCLAGLEHDGRRDTALVRGNDEGSGAFYHCTGGRCGHTMTIVDPQPFEPLDEDGDDDDEPEVVSGDLWSMANNAMLYLSEAPLHAAAFDAKASPKTREQAVGWVCQHIFEIADIRMIEGVMRWFDGVLWTPVFREEGELFRWIQEIYRQLGFGALASNVSAVTNVENLIKRTVRVSTGSGAGNFVNLQNGMINLDTMKLVPHDREELFITALPFAYDAAAKAPVWEAFVARIMCGSAPLIEALQNAMGYLFTRNLHLEIMIGLVGEGANGKSTLIDVIAELVGETGASYMPLQTITKASGDGLYSRVGLSGRWVNFTQELSPRTMESTEFKNLITGKNIIARDPFGKTFTIASAPKQVCAMNSTEHLIKERTHGFMRRLWLIPFNYTVPEQERDRWLAEKLRKELAGIFNWVLDGTSRVLTNGCLSQSAEMVRLKSQIELDSNPVQQFMLERTAPHEGLNPDEIEPKNKLYNMVVGVSEMYQKYKEFCDHNNYRPLGRNKFSHEVERLGYMKLNFPVKIDGLLEKVSGFYLQLLKPAEWRDSEVQMPLKQVT